MGLITKRWASAAHRGLVAELDTAVSLCEDRGLVDQSAPEVSAWSIKWLRFAYIHHRHNGRIIEDIRTSG